VQEVVKRMSKQNEEAREAALAEFAAYKVVRNEEGAGEGGGWRSRE
jgi:hypothetical protein